MKVRTDFVTNSSSSSFIIVSKIDYCQELLEYMKEEHGNHGVRLLNELIVTGEEIRKDNPDEILYKFERYNALDRLTDEDRYLYARFITYTDGDDFEGDDAWLHEHIPEKYMQEIFQTECS